MWRAALRCSAPGHGLRGCLPRDLRFVCAHGKPGGRAGRNTNGFPRQLMLCFKKKKKSHFSDALERKTVHAPLGKGARCSDRPEPGYARGAGMLCAHRMAAGRRQDQVPPSPFFPQPCCPPRAGLILEIDRNGAVCVNHISAVWQVHTATCTLPLLVCSLVQLRLLVMIY